MSDQRDLFGDTEPPRARPSHPDTSHEAARAITQDGTVGRNQNRTLDALRRHPGMTTNELEDIDGVRGGTYRKRMSELETMGLAFRVAKRPCRITHRNAYAWEAKS